MSDDSFVHLHVHSEYSMLDGAAKMAPLFAEASRLGMPAVGLTDHGNMYGADEFYRQAEKTGIKPIIGIEAYIAPTSRFHKKPVFWGQASQRSTDASGEGGDVSGAGAYTHMTMLAGNTTGLRNLFKLSSIASFEGKYRSPAMDRELISEHAEGIIATTGCPSGEVQTRLRLGQPAEALQAASDYRDIFGKDNFFLELMDHGLTIEARRSARGCWRSDESSACRRWPPTTATTSPRTRPRRTRRCCACSPARRSTTRTGSSSTVTATTSSRPSEMRAYWDTELPGRRATTRC